MDETDFPLTFRYCVSGDVPAMLAVSDTLFDSMYNSAYFEHATKHSDKIFALGCFSSNNNLLGFIIMVKNCVASGFLEECSSENEQQFAQSFDNMIACITTLGVHKSAQQRSIGSFLIAQAIHHLKVFQINAVYLHVNSMNKVALRFYTKLGFKVHNLIKDYYSAEHTGGFSSRDAYVMYKNLSSSDRIAQCG